MREATLCFLVRERSPRQILLGYKKVGFGAGKYNGFGGKVEPGETIEQAAVRELAEETGIRVPASSLRPAAVLTFYFPASVAWDQRVHVFLVDAWQGEPVEGREMRPVWFDVAAIPFEEMWQDDRDWLPRVLAGKRVEARYVFADDNETVLEATVVET